MTTTVKTISIEVLAEKLNGKLWTKGDLKRIYLDCGYNTKKMTTKTYVYQNENGDFKVSCCIDCPSQNFNWIKSQQNEVIESVESQIEKAILLLNTELIEFKASENIEGDYDVLVKVENEEAIWYNEEEFYSKFGEYPYAVFSTIPAPQPMQITKPVEVAVNTQSIEKTTEANGIEVEIDKKYIHAKHGIGTVISIEKEGKIIKMDFGGEIKVLMTGYVKLEAAND